MQKPGREKIREFLRQSNYIENERSEHALEGAIRAWRYAYNNELSLDYILTIHKLLLKNIRPDIAGKIRNCDVYIGGHCKHFISETLIKENLEKIIKMMKFDYKGFNLEMENYAKHCHVQFEDVHPFVDGNGRVGRILYNIHRLRLDLPIHIIYEGKQQMQYYQWFK